MTFRTQPVWMLAALAGLHAQTTPKFEVASVKPAIGCANSAGRSGGTRDAATPGRLELQCQTVAGLIAIAYGRGIGIAGGPAWITADRYDIAAKTDGSQPAEAIRGPMLQELLADRFQLKLHSENRDVPAYVLSLGKGAPKLQAAVAGKCTPRGSPRQPGLYACGVFAPSPAHDGSYMYGTTLANFCDQLSAVLDRRVVDRTGIDGVFDIFVETSPSPPEDATPPDHSLTGSLGSAVLGAIQKLGLKLEPGKAPKEFLVIDRVERPSEN